MNDDFELVRGSGNVFHDFCRINANVEQARAILAAEIICTLDKNGLSSREAEKLTGVAYSEFSRIRNGCRNILLTFQPQCIKYPKRH